MLIYSLPVNFSLEDFKKKQDILEAAFKHPIEQFTIDYSGKSPLLCIQFKNK